MPTDHAAFLSDFVDSRKEKRILLSMISTTQVKRSCRLLSKDLWIAILIRASHLALCFGVLTSLLVKESILHYMLWSRVDIVQGSIYLVLFAISVVLYMVASCMDPGYVPLNKKDTAREMEQTDSEEEDYIESGDGSKLKLRFCFECRLKQPLRARHCVDCKRCVRKYDHHCPWLGNCVGESNHRVFVCFLLCQTAVIWWTARMTWYSFLTHPTWGEWFSDNIFYLLDMIVVIVAGLPLSCLLCFHIYLAITNTTTWESVSRERISYLKYLDERYNPFHQGYLRNLVSFCCTNGAYPWHLLYAKPRCRQNNEEEATTEEREGLV